MADYKAYATACIEGLQHWYNRDSGLWESTGWWNAANALEAVIDYSHLTGNTEHTWVIENTFEKNKGDNFLNDYYDDEGWWALAWIKAYDLTQDTRYLNMAKFIFQDMSVRWDDVCGGGIWWREKKDYKNAITNELFLFIAACLARRTGEEGYLTWIEKEWFWFQKSGMLNEQHLINDGLDENCHNNGQTTWTYNQGVILGALAEMFYCWPGDSYFEGREEYLIEASWIANAALDTLVRGYNILTEPCEDGDCGNDGPQFKGIFMRNLAHLARVNACAVRIPHTYEPYKIFILRNADAI